MSDTPRAGWGQRTLDRIERWGNRLPEPATLFLILIALVLGISWLAGMADVSAEHPGTGERIEAVNLLDRDGIQRIFTAMVDNFAQFPPLGLVLVAMLGLGVAERSGLIEALLRGVIAWTPKKWATGAVVLAGLLSSIAADAGYVVLIPLGAVLFHGMGRHPLAGLAAAFAGVSAGFSANLVLTSLDPLLVGFTGPAAALIDETYNVDPAANWFLMATLVPVFTLTGVFVTERIITPRLGVYSGEANAEKTDTALAPKEKRGLRGAAIAVAVCLAVLIWMTLPANAIFRDEAGQLSPLLDSLVPLMLILFFIPGLVYGRLTGSITSEKQAVAMTSETMSGMGGYIVLAFVAAQFVAYFEWSQLGSILAIQGAAFLDGLGVRGIPLLLGFILVSAFINLFVGSASSFAQPAEPARDESRSPAPQQQKPDKPKGQGAAHHTAPAGEASQEPPPSAQPTAVAAPERAFLADVREHPDSGVASRYQRLGLSVRQGQKLKTWLLQQGLIAEEETRTSTGRLTVLRLTEKGEQRLGRKGEKG